MKEDTSMTKSKNQPSRKCIDCVHNVISVCMRTRMPVGISDAACEQSHIPAYAETVCRGCRGVCKLLKYELKKDDKNSETQNAEQDTSD